MSASDSAIRPILSIEIELHSDSDREAFLRALDELAEHDQSLRIGASSSHERIILSGATESHLRGICYRVMGELGVAAVLSKPRVIYLETIQARAVGQGRYMRQTSGSGNYGHVILRIDPLERGRGFTFAVGSEPVGIPDHYLLPIERGIREAMHGGTLAGHEMLDVKVTLVGGSHHAADSNATAFQIAASMAFKEAARKANPAVLEPFMSLEVVFPEQFMHAVIGDLSRRRGQCEAIEDRPWAQAVRAKAPLTELLGYSTALSAITQGWGESSMKLDGYELTSRGGWHGDEEAGVPVRTPGNPNSEFGSEATILYC